MKLRRELMVDGRKGDGRCQCRKGVARRGRSGAKAEINRQDAKDAEGRIENVKWGRPAGRMGVARRGEGETETGGWKAARTGGLESPPYAAFQVALLSNVRLPRLRVRWKSKT